jgi:predicted transcriptional regulator
MLSRAVPFARVATRSLARPVGSRAFTAASIEDASTAADAAALSGYSDIDFVINDDSPVIDAVQRFAAYNIGCLVTIDAAGKSLVTVDIY